MLELFVTVYENWNNYVFGSETVAILGFFLFVMTFMIVNGFSIETMISMILLGSIVTAIWLVPTWIVTMITIVVGLMMAWVLVRILGGS